MWIAAGDGGYFVSEIGHGRIAHVDANGTIAPVLEHLTRPKGMALYQGNLLVLDAGARTLQTVDLSSRQAQLIASDLPIGATGPMDFPGGLTVGPDQTIYIAGDAEGSLLTVRQV